MSKNIPDARSNYNLEEKLLSVIKSFLIKLERNRSALAVSIHSNLDKDLGIDSIAKVELFHEIEDHFQLYLSDELLAQAMTVNDILEALKVGHSETSFKSDIIQSAPNATHFSAESSQSLVELLLYWAKREPQRPHIYYQDEKGTEKIITFKLLLENAQKVANGLYALGIRSHDTVAIMLPTSEAFFYCFMGVQLLGAVPVPIYPPFRPDKIEEYALREEKILKKAEVSVLITFDRAEKLSELLSAFIHSLKTVTTYEKLIVPNKKAPIQKVKEDHPALIQFTSGSTNVPKGVLLSHRNLLSNIECAGRAIDVRSNEVVVSWLPLYHDMGLIGCWFGSLYHACPLVIMSPLSFLSRPERWLWAIHYHRGTISAAPNFAYELCIKRIKEKDIEGLDLSTWRLSLNGAEAVNPRTVEGFIKKFQPYGFKPETFFPVYGLAESTVALCFPPIERAPKIDRIDLMDYERQRIARAVTDESRKHLKFVCCGQPIPEHEVRIVNEQNQELPERMIGSIQFKGPSTMQGYYNNIEATQAIFKEGWCETGDFGYFAEGEIYITGRKKDIIIKAGRNLFPEVIEDVTGQVNGVRKGAVVAFGVVDSRLGTEKLIIVAESREHSKDVQSKMIQAIVERVTLAIGIPPDEIKIVSPNTIPKTSSGKLQRSQCKMMYESGSLTKWNLPLWLQITKIFLKGCFSKGVNKLSTVFQFLYTCYVWIISIIVIFPVWFMVMTLSPVKSRGISRIGAKILLKLACIKIKIIDPSQSLKNDVAKILVANHASYIDGLILYSILPDNFSFIVKKGVFKAPLLKSLMLKHQHFGVDREDFQKNIEDTKNIIDSLKHGRSLAVFPEGTFIAAKGLRAFKSGAFKIATQNNLPVLPVALSGTREVLRSQEWLLKPNTIQVTAGELLYPNENSWQEMTRLQSQARAFIVSHCGESSIEM